MGQTILQWVKQFYNGSNNSTMEETTQSKIETKKMKKACHSRGSTMKTGEYRV